MASSEEYSIDVLNVDLLSEDFVIAEENEVMTLTEEELAELLAQGSDGIQEEEIFEVPANSVQPLFLCFVQRCMKVILGSELAYDKLEEALDTVGKLVDKAGSDKMADLSVAVMVHHPTAIPVFLDFVLSVWQGELADSNAADEVEAHSRVLVRLVWNLLESYEGSLLPPVVVPNVLRDLAESLGKFQNVTLTQETHTFISLYIVKLLRTMAREESNVWLLFEWNSADSLARLLPSQPIEIQTVIKSLIGRLIPYCTDAVLSDRLRGSILMTGDDLSFVLHTLVPSCEMVDGSNIKARRLLSMIRDLAVNPGNKQSLVDNGAQEVFLELVEGDGRLKEEVISSLSSDGLAAVPVNSDSFSDPLHEKPQVAAQVPTLLTACTSTGVQVPILPLDDGTIELVNGILLELTKCVGALQRDIENCNEADFDGAVVIHAMTLSTMLLNVNSAEGLCGSEWQEPIADYVAENASFVESLCNLLHICYTHKFSKDVLGIAFTSGYFIQTCLIQWTHHSSAMCQAVSAADLVHYLLSVLDQLKDKVFSEMEIESVQTILCLLYNIARREQNRPAFYSADATMCVLVPYTLCSSSRIGLYAKCVLSFLQLLMYDDELRCLELTAEDLTFFVNALSTLLTSEEATASGFSLEEILVILNNMASVDKNLLAFQTKPEIFTALDEIVLSAVEFVRKQSICLLFKFDPKPGNC